MQPLVDYVKVELNLANDIIDNDLVAINVAYGGVEFTQVRAHRFLTFFKSLLACLQLANIGNKSMPNWTSVMESLLHHLFKVLHFLFNTLHPGIDAANPSFEIVNSCEDRVAIALW